MPRGQCHRHGPRPCTCAMGNLYRFVEPVLLYLLKKNGPSYGYELADALNEHALTDSEIERAALYRALQRLEMNGRVISQWDTSGSGPARHFYKLTESGDRHLHEWHEVLENMAQSMARFVEDLHQLEQSETSNEESSHTGRDQEWKSRETESVPA